MAIGLCGRGLLSALSSKESISEIDIAAILRSLVQALQILHNHVSAWQTCQPVVSSRQTCQLLLAVHVLSLAAWSAFFAAHSWLLRLRLPKGLAWYKIKELANQARAANAVLQTTSSMHICQDSTCGK